VEWVTGETITPLDYWMTYAYQVDRLGGCAIVEKYRYND
jgi:hypothetical protein